MMYTKEQQVGKRRKRVKITAAYSTRNRYSDSRNQTWTSSQIETRINKSKTKKSFEGIRCCERCQRNGRLDMSHTVSVKWAKENGMVELCWDLKNIKLLCREICHPWIESHSAEDRMRIYKNDVI